MSRDLRARAIGPALRGLVAGVLAALCAGRALAFDPARGPPAVQVFRPSGAVYAVAQTSDGYVWLGTADGLHRFDGVRFEHFGAVGGALPHDRVSNLLAASDGSLYIATSGGGPGSNSWERGAPGLTRLYRGRFVRVPMDAEPEAGDRGQWVTALAESSDGTVWVGTRSGLARVSGGRAAAVVASEGLPRGAITGLFRDHDGSLWVGSTAGLFRWVGARFVGTPIDKPVGAFARTTDGTLWVIRNHELQRLRTAHDGTITVLETFSRAAGDPLPHSNISLAADEGGKLWVGGTDGLRLVRRGAAGLELDAHYDGNRSLPDRFVTTLARDREGGLWAGTRAGGVARLTEARVWNFGLGDDPASDVGFAVLAAHDGSVWRATARGLSRLQGGRTTSYRFAHELPATGVRSLAEDARGRLWATADGLGFLRHDGRPDGGTFEVIPIPLPAARGQVTTVAFDQEGHLYLTWGNGGVTVWPGADVARPGRFFGPAEGGCERRLWAVARARHGGVWLGGASGQLQRTFADRVTCIDTGAPKVGAEILGLHEDGAGALWIGGLNTPGLTRYRDGQLTTFSQGISEPAYGIAEDGAGALWFGSRRGVYRVARHSLLDFESGRAAGIGWLRFGHADGMRSDEGIAAMSPLGAIDAGGRFWFPTLLGISAVAPPGEGADGAERVPPPLPVVETLRAGDQRYFPGDRIVVAAAQRNLEIQYTAPWFSVPQQLSFEYRLRGYDKTWVVAGARRVAYYTNLAPGDYRFEVRVRPGDGAFHAARQALVFTLNSHLHQRPWFYPLVLVLALVLAVGFHRVRLLRAEQRHAEIHRERARLARELHDNLGQGFTSLGYHLDAIRTIGASEKTASIAERGRALLNHCQAEVRRLIWDLRTEGDRTPSLAEGVREVVERARVVGGPEIVFRAVATGGPEAVDPVVRHELPLVVQEALTNALRHAGARHIVVEIDAESGATRVRVKDDGSGMVAPATGAQRGAGFGLIGMEERARRMGARLTVVSAPGEGTEITVSVPAQPARDAEGSAT